MFEVELKDVSTFKKIIDSIKDIVKEAPFDCCDYGMQLLAMDPSHTVLVFLKLEKSFFMNYLCDKTTSIGLKMEDVYNSLNCAGKNDICSIQCQDDTVLFTFKNFVEMKTQNITIPRMIVDDEYLTVPDQKFSAVIEMSSVKFSKLMGDMARFTVSVEITVTNEGFTFLGENDYGGSIEVQYDDVPFIFRENVSFKCSLPYMQMFAKASAISDRVRLSISADHPIMVEYKIGEDAGNLRFHLAP